MKRIFGFLALAVLLSGISALPGCTVNLNSSGASAGYNAAAANDAAFQGMLEKCYMKGGFWINAHKNQTVLGMNVVAGKAYVSLNGWNGDQCSVILDSDTKSYRCSYTGAELNQSGLGVLETIATRCGYASESERLCVGTGTIGTFLGTNESC
jgi:hypothetical protein